jgi:hypothetical protein
MVLPPVMQSAAKSKERRLAYTQELTGKFEALQVLR